MSVIGWMIGGVWAVTGSAVATVYGLTVKAQRPKVVPNEQVPPVPYEEVEWISGGLPVKGWLLVQPHAAAPGPVVIVAHGWGSNRSRVLRYALPLYEEGYSVLMYDARSHGESGFYKTPTGLLFRDDLLSAIAWLKTRPEIDPARIGVLGHSLGGYGAVLALDEGAPIAALVTDAMPVRLSAMIATELRRRRLPRFPLASLVPWIMVWRSGISKAAMRKANPARILRDNEQLSKKPVLLVHSRNDGFIPPSELEYVVTRVPGVRHLFVDSEGHSASERDPAFWPEVRSFYREALQKK
ncbi:alpha/beta hydrolase [Paenibacillaceae bacterium WGS1546]|uniref:alpha/beta hydrolase n=1 Tax=Cohnella sp. WGS1546 TaxID=3366810 RepID=UPI00372CFD64